MPVCEEKARGLRVEETIYSLFVGAQALLEHLRLSCKKGKHPSEELAMTEDQGSQFFILLVVVAEDHI